MNKILLGDCSEIMRQYIPKDTVDLVYLDPPFFTQKDWKGKAGEFSDRWDSLEDYLYMITKRLHDCLRVLKDTGTIYLHCDQTASHYIKVKMDSVFGIENFIGEIIWHRKNKLDDKRVIWRKFHDNILCYSKTSTKVVNQLVLNTGEMITCRGRKKVNGKIGYTGEMVTYEKKKCLTRSVIDDVTDITSGGRNKERVGYPTQKPLKLLHRIIKASSNEGDTVLDPFCGSGTTCVAAKELGRNYIGIDKSEQAVKVTQDRLADIPQNLSF